MHINVQIIIIVNHWHINTTTCRRNIIIIALFTTRCRHTHTQPQILTYYLFLQNETLYWCSRYKSTFTMYHKNKFHNHKVPRFNLFQKPGNFCLNPFTLKLLILQVPASVIDQAVIVWNVDIMMEQSQPQTIQQTTNTDTHTHTQLRPNEHTLTDRQTLHKTISLALSHVMWTTLNARQLANSNVTLQTQNYVSLLTSQNCSSSSSSSSSSSLLTSNKWEPTDDLVTYKPDTRSCDLQTRHDLAGLCSRSLHLGLETC